MSGTACTRQNRFFQSGMPGPNTLKVDLRGTLRGDILRRVEDVLPEDVVRFVLREYQERMLTDALEDERVALFLFATRRFSTRERSQP